jgi:RluA family pseudouridine synthase
VTGETDPDEETDAEIDARASRSATPDPKRDARERLSRAGIEILLEDNHLLVISKPAGLLSQAGPQDAVALPEVLAAYRRDAEGKTGRGFVGLVHRLDRNVSGIMVIAKTSKAASRIGWHFARRTPELRKTYLAWVSGRPAEDHGEFVTRLTREGRVTREARNEEEEAREARLTYVVEARGGQAARLRIDLHTGLSHQIRAQLAVAGHPLVGDRKYGGPDGPRPALHALRLVFPHPVQGTPVDLSAAIPADLLEVDRALRMKPPLAPWFGNVRG